MGWYDFLSDGEATEETAERVDLALSIANLIYVEQAGGIETLRQMIDEGTQEEIPPDAK
jgi:hypothetical protein